MEDALDGELDLEVGLAGGCAGHPAQQVGEEGSSGIEIFREVVGNLGAVVRRGSAPGFGLVRGFHGIADVLAATARDFCEGAAVGIEHDRAVALVRPDLVAADVELVRLIDGGSRVVVGLRGIVGFARCASRRARTVSPTRPCSALASFARSAAAPGGGLGTAAPSRLCTIHCPRTTGDVRFGADVVVKMLPWPSSPRRGLSAGSATRRM